MRELKRMGCLLALTLTIAVSVNTQKVYAAEADAATKEMVSTDLNTEADVDTDNTDAADVEMDNTDTVDADTDNTDVTDVDTANADVDTTSISNDIMTNICAYTNAVTTAVDVQKEDVTVYTTWNSENGYDDVSKENVVDISGEEGEILETIFKLNFVGARTISNAFDHKDDLTGYCENLPSGLTLEKYTSNGGCNYMRVKLYGEAATGAHQVTITIPKDKLSAYKGYQVPENGVSVTIYLTVNGEKIPVTIPVTQGNHEHSYDWVTLKAATETEDGVEAHMCSCGDVEYKRPISAYGLWLKSVKEQILNADENATVEIETDIWNTY